MDLPARDADWSPDHWRALLESLIAAEIVTWEEVTSLALGHLNPSQVGTSIATKKSFQRHYLPRQCWAQVRAWHFAQRGRCEDCGTRLELQADHLVPKEVLLSAGRAVAEENEGAGLTPADLLPQCLHAIADRIPERDRAAIPAGLVDALAADLAECVAAGGQSDEDLKDVADRLENMLLRCRRCNVVRRPSHVQGGVTHQTAEAALMWILLTRRPGTYDEYLALCREYGLTMANIRMEEAWAMARWLNREGRYDISSTSKYAP